MAARKSKRPVTTVKIDRDAKTRLEALHKGVMRFELPRYVDQMEVVSALAMFTTPEQLHGMLLGYWRYLGGLPEADTGNDPEAG